MDFFLMEDHALIETMAGTIATKTFTPELIASLSSGIISLFLFYDGTGSRAVEDLFKLVVKKDLAGQPNTPENRRRILGNSLTAMCYRNMAKHFGKEFLQRIFVPPLEAMRKGKAFSKLDKKGLQFIGGFLDQVKKELSNCPLYVKDESLGR